MRNFWPTAIWPTATPQEHGIDPEKLDALRAHIPRVLPQIRSVLIVHRGSLVFEDYYHGLSADDDHEIASVTKSVTSATIGLALTDGHLDSVDQPVWELLPAALQRPCPAAYEGVTLRHLLTLTSGFRWDESRFREWLAAPNQLDFALRLPRRDPPGERFRYNTPAMHLLSAIVQRATGQSLSDYARERLFAPLGIKHFRWQSDQQGHSLAGLGLALRARDLAKLGLLFASEGMWENRPLITKDWIQLSTSTHTAGGPPEGEAYGFLWWITKLGEQRSFFAAGFGGQFLYVVPAKDLVVVITSSLHAPHRENRTIVQDFILPALHR